MDTFLTAIVYLSYFSRAYYGIFPYSNSRLLYKEYFILDQVSCWKQKSRLSIQRKSKNLLKWSRSCAGEEYWCGQDQTGDAGSEHSCGTTWDSGNLKIHSWEALAGLKQSSRRKLWVGVTKRKDPPKEAKDHLKHENCRVREGRTRNSKAGRRGAPPGLVTAESSPEEAQVSAPQRKRAPFLTAFPILCLSLNQNSTNCKII